MHKLDGQEMNVKKLWGEEISQIMEKTTVDFISVTSSIYHHFFFLDPPLIDVRW